MALRITGWASSRPSVSREQSRTCAREGIQCWSGHSTSSPPDEAGRAATPLSLRLRAGHKAHLSPEGPRRSSPGDDRDPCRDRAAASRSTNFLAAQGIPPKRSYFIPKRCPRTALDAHPNGKYEGLMVDPSGDAEPGVRLVSPLGVEPRRARQPSVVRSGVRRVILPAPLVFPGLIVRIPPDPVRNQIETRSRMSQRSVCAEAVIRDMRLAKRTKTRDVFMLGRDWREMRGGQRIRSGCI
jgi:hypothetical protein